MARRAVFSDSHDQFVDSEVSEAYWIGDFLLKGEGEYKYLFYKGRWYVVDGLCEIDGITPINRPILVAKAIEIWLM